MTTSNAELRHLRPATAAWVKAMRGTFSFESPHERLLILAAEAWDRGVEARERIAADGAYAADRFGQIKAHPALAVERDSRLSFARLVRELGLEDDEPGAAPRPPAIQGRYSS